jgi:hypothetical protein
VATSGATIVDEVLQAQRDYDTYATPRTKRILEKWPRDKTVTALLVQCYKIDQGFILATRTRIAVAQRCSAKLVRHE